MIGFGPMKTKVTLTIEDMENGDKYNFDVIRMDLSKGIMSKEYVGDITAVYEGEDNCP